MTKEQALAVVDKALARIPQLRAGAPRSAQHIQFIQSTGLDLARVFGPQSGIVKNFAAIDYNSVGNFVASAFDLDKQLTRRRMGAYLVGLDHAEGILRSAREQLEDFGVDHILRGARSRAEGPTIFVSHGTETQSLEKLERYIRSLGGTPVIVGRGPSKGMAVDDLVEERIKECDCAIILATADEEIAGRRQPRPNVLHEIGLAQQVLDSRVIYLKEVGCEFPSNVGPKVWENFTQENMERAFEKVAKELRALELL